MEKENDGRGDCAEKDFGIDDIHNVGGIVTGNNFTNFTTSEAGHCSSTPNICLFLIIVSYICLV